MLRIFNSSKREKANTKVAIPTYSKVSSITAPDYESGRIMDEFLTGLDQECDEFFKKARNMDSDNGAFLDQRIKAKANETIKSLERESSEHRRLIVLPLERMHEGHGTLSGEIIHIRERELEKIRHQLKAYRDVYYSGTSLEDSLGGNRDE